MSEIIYTQNRSLIDHQAYYQVHDEVSKGIDYICRDILNAKIFSTDRAKIVRQLRTPVWHLIFNLKDSIQDIQFYLPHEK